MKKVRNNKVENENRKENETKPKPNDLKKKGDQIYAQSILHSLIFLHQNVFWPELVSEDLITYFSP
jgi:hypothetical protein